MNELDFVKKCRDSVVYFAEHMLFDETGDKYHLEPHQKAMMMSSEGNVVYFCGRRMGKSLMLAIEAIHRALFFKYQKIFILSPTESQAKELANTIDGLIERSAIVENELKVNNIMEKKLKNGSRLIIKTSGGKGSVSSVIGSGANMLVLDEVQDMPDTLISKIIPIQRGQ